MSDQTVKQWDEYFSINCYLPAGAIQDLFFAIEEKDTRIAELRDTLIESEYQRGCLLKRIAELGAEQKAWRKFTDEANATMDKAEARIAELELALEKIRDHKSPYLGLRDTARAHIARDVLAKLQENDDEKQQSRM